MPTSYTDKIYVTDGIYHVYNRGAHKQKIFVEDPDYTYFLKLLKRTLAKPKIKTNKGYTEEFEDRLTPNMYGKIKLFCFGLMPNHYHLILQQSGINDMTTFTRKVFTSYSMYFNKKYDHSGTLFQGKYKAKIISDDNYLIHCSRYVHINPSEAGLVTLRNLQNYDYCSYKDYVGLRKLSFLNRNYILKAVGSKNGESKFKEYKNFVEAYKLKDSEQELVPQFLGYDD